MKKLVAISIMAAMLLAIGVAAMATESQWQFLMRASDASGNGYGSNFTAGTKTTSFDSKDTNDVAGGFTSTGVANIMAYNAAYGGTPALYSSDYRSVITGTQTEVWDLCLWRMQAATFNTLKLVWWAGGTAPQNNDPMPSYAGVAYNYTIEVINDPTGQNSGFKWSSADPNGGSATAPLASLNWTALGGTAGDATAAKGDQNYAVDNAIKLRLTVAPAVVTPEPSSMLALASGIFGMAGFAIRRRK